jgi:hypothetical protein
MGICTPEIVDRLILAQIGSTGVGVVTITGSGRPWDRASMHEFPAVPGRSRPLLTTAGRDPPRCGQPRCRLPVVRPVLFPRRGPPGLAMLGMDRAIVARRGKPPWFMPIGLGLSVTSARTASAPGDNGPATRITSAARPQVAAKRGRTIHPAYSEAISGLTAARVPSWTG